MAGLVYSVIASLDGYVTDAGGDFGWAAPDEEVHRYVNELERPVGTYLYGRRMYEVMRYWETAGAEPGRHPVAQDFAAIWRAADKVVYSTTLDAPSTARTRLERSFEPEAVRRMVAEAERPVGVGGPTLAAEALRAGLVGTCHLFLVPVVVGGGTPVFPAGVRLGLDLVGERRFASGFVHLHYRVN